MGLTEWNIKNMVCARCIKTVTGIFHQAGITDAVVTLGKVSSARVIPAQTEQDIRQALEQEGFEVLDDQRVKKVKEIKTAIIELVHHGELDEMKEKLSAYLSSRLLKDYHYLSNIFSAVENTTIEQYFILQKIEKVKEWLVYDELTLNEIAFRLGYSSVAHLSAQFKKVTGFTPSQFKKLKDHHRRPLDSF